MTAKDQVLSALENSRGQYISGEQLANSLFVSRNAVWKAISALRAEGYQIDGATNRGYCLQSDSSILSAQSVGRHLGDCAGAFRILTQKSAGSTNSALKEAAAKGETEGLVLIAEEQTAGRGRMNRGFFSPAKTGLYMSLLLRPKVTAAESPLITIAAATAVAEAIEALSQKPVRIKWVNDLLIGGKKVCGILTEAAMDVESGMLDYAVLGVGVNLVPPEGGFPPELHQVASAVFAQGECPADGTSRLAAEILKRFLGYYCELDIRRYLHGYRERSAVIGRDVVIVGSGETVHALAIDEDGRLVVRQASGEIKALGAGEISIKPAEGFNI